MTAPPDLPGFLLARAADLEAKAPDIHEAGCFSSWWEHDRTGYSAAECNCGVPARVLADCAAQRAIVELHEHVGSWLSEWDEGDPIPVESGLFGCRICALDDRQIEPEGWCDTLLALAQPDADHPAFDPSWRA